jgi:Ser/Thr protein kinase RdoA (MazF antagonist)
MNETLKDVNLEEIVSHLFKSFNKVEFIEQVSRPTNKNLSYKIRLNEINCILKIYLQRNMDEIIQCINVQKFFYNQGLPCQRVLTIEGESLFKINNYYSIFEYLDAEVIKNATSEDVSKIFETLSLFHSAGENYPKNFFQDRNRIPPLEEGVYKKDFEKFRREYNLLEKSLNGKFGVIHGDFNLGQVLKSKKGDISILDFESVKLGDSLEDFASFIFYFRCMKKEENTSQVEIINDVIKDKTYYLYNKDNLRSYFMRTALRYNMGSIWEFNREYINKNELLKRFKTLDRAVNLEI